MKEQDKTIYRQLMTLNSNISRLKKEIKGEEDVKRKYDMALEYDYDSLDSDESCSDFDISDIEEDDTQIKQLVTNLSMTESSLTEVILLFTVLLLKINGDILDLLQHCKMEF